MEMPVDDRGVWPEPHMQVSVPEVMNINNEPGYIHQLYGTTPGKASFANNCLLARKLVEQGVRFVQLFDWGWDMHGTSENESVDIGLKNKCRLIDRPMSALLLDLKQRGLLDETLVSGEVNLDERRCRKTGKARLWLSTDGITMLRHLPCGWLAEGSGKV